MKTSKDDTSPPPTPDKVKNRQRFLIGGDVSSDSSDEGAAASPNGRGSPIRRSYESKYRKQSKAVEVLVTQQESVQRLRSALRTMKSMKSLSEFASEKESTNSPRGRRVKFRDELGGDQHIATYRYFVTEETIDVNSDTMPELLVGMVGRSQCCAVS